MRQKRIAVFIVLSVFLAGCASKPLMDEPQQPMTAMVELEAAPAALSLLRRAEQVRQQGQLPAAERYLERALNIAPDSSWLYRELADLRLSEGDARGAEGFALKALRLAPDHDDYRAGLWEMVATARERQGDRDGARDARSRAATLRDPVAKPV